MIVIYRDVEDYHLDQMEVESLNQFAGADVSHTQVLRSAAGYYIGDLCKEKELDNQWFPNSRDSQDYWELREDAEHALKTNSYKRKF